MQQSNPGAWFSRNADTSTKNWKISYHQPFGGTLCPTSKDVCVVNNDIKDSSIRRDVYSIWRDINEVYWCT
ncbi:uncharacterized protein H6S33_010790 [Morchella sextelata]|uniref:uncharacterized protein n=1 Tax=Morchella sextelata TaxID=1174677 RepID=UPI001D053832|nr:uncharacterized protein H6S33_010790 [Morchella sextelata]KAH0611525.1 hypothetical protein H6S33_010790 [Morchella sextelata]